MHDVSFSFASCQISVSNGSLLCCLTSAYQEEKPLYLEQSNFCRVTTPRLKVVNGVIALRSIKSVEFQGRSGKLVFACR